ncbi:alpha/beta hydrolase [Nocardia pseudovaccinii]|uniref:alpha/beta hydrolase n=1 Tax=Nocardia pseudovaccinii TaxID=189540 RepID=UPI003D89E2C3
MNNIKRRFRAPATQHRQEPILLQEQGSFAFGGSVIRRPDGQTVHVDHGYVQYQIPVDAKDHAIVMWHGWGQTGRTWETTPDGREGFQSIFVRHGFPVYIIDQPRRGRAGSSSVGVTLPGASDPDFFITDQFVFEAFRLGTWASDAAPKFASGVSFDRGEHTLNQYLRQVAMSTGPDLFDEEVKELFSGAVATLLDEIGPCVLLTHSTCGPFGWRVAMKSTSVKGVVGYETSPFAFPESDPPESVPFDIPELADWVAPDLRPDPLFDRLTKIPVQVVFGDNVDIHPEYRPYHARARQFIDVLRARGGDAELLELVEHGLRGNTHFPFSDLNNLEVADLLIRWLSAKGLDA